MNIDRDSGEKTLFDKILTNPFGEEEGPVEQKLRETGEWILDTTEGPTRSAGIIPFHSSFPLFSNVLS